MSILAWEIVVGLGLATILVIVFSKVRQRVAARARQNLLAELTRRFPAAAALAALVRDNKRFHEACSRVETMASNGQFADAIFPGDLVLSDALQITRRLSGGLSSLSERQVEQLFTIPAMMPCSWSQLRSSGELRKKLPLVDYSDEVGSLGAVLGRVQRQQGKRLFSRLEAYALGAGGGTSERRTDAAYLVATEIILEWSPSETTEYVVGMIEEVTASLAPNKASA